MATVPLFMVVQAFACLGSTWATVETRSTNSGDERAAAIVRRPWLQWIERCGERVHSFLAVLTLAWML